MGHNKWMIACFGCLGVSAIPGGLGMTLGILACVVCAGGCFAKWLVEEDKFQQAEYEEYMKNLQKKGLTNRQPCTIINISKERKR